MICLQGRHYTTFKKLWIQQHGMLWHTPFLQNLQNLIFIFHKSQKTIQNHAPSHPKQQFILRFRGEQNSLAVEHWDESQKTGPCDLWVKLAVWPSVSHLLSLSLWILIHEIRVWAESYWCQYSLSLNDQERDGRQKPETRATLDTPVSLDQYPAGKGCFTS